MLGQPVDGLAQPAVGLAVDQAGERIGLGGGDLGVAEFVLPPRASLLVDQQVAGDAVEPDAEAFGVGERIERRPGAEQGVLDDVVGAGGPAEAREPARGSQYGRRAPNACRSLVCLAQIAIARGTTRGRSDQERDEPAGMLRNSMWHDAPRLIALGENGRPHPEEIPPAFSHGCRLIPRGRSVAQGSSRRGVRCPGRALRAVPGRTREKRPENPDRIGNKIACGCI